MKNIYQNLPQTPGVYLMKDGTGKILYIGKAVNLRRRVSSYFTRPHDMRIERMVERVKSIGFQRTDSALEALILESKLIKKHQPQFNIREKDDKSFLYVEITNDEFPRVFLVRGKNKSMRGTKRFGPFISASSIREALRIIRKIFPWSIHDPKDLGAFKRPCFDYEIGLCPGTCIGKAGRREYMQNIKHLRLFFEGRKDEIVKQLRKVMALVSRELKFEEALKFRRQIFALQHIQDIALISDESAEDAGVTSVNKRYRIEGYDISNISGTSAVGAMVVFVGGKADKNQYRKFKIYTIDQPNDVGMLREVITRRIEHEEWPVPDLVLIDGGKAQVNAVDKVFESAGLKIPVVGIAKGPERKKNEFIGVVPEHINPGLLIKIRDEAHRFAIQYHKAVRRKAFVN
ncbi:excinuclease ABC subunit UvrC [Candidatus Jorgensenbacteria bacterium]|nr:excinuclease ABC subunit UvrC [Candidatus Jorgensenbacteria bacterium]